jgi:aminobenzoyl-glutamate utilization protein B
MQQQIPGTVGALDAAELFTTGINFMREHVKPSVRMHYVYKMEAKFNVIQKLASGYGYVTLKEVV